MCRVLDPARIDDTKSRFNIHNRADKAEVTSPSLSRTYNNLDLKTVYGIYYNMTDKMLVHVPYNVALSLLLQ